ncbi:MAG: peroxiredoxin family protein [Myxococcaceae bacterium]|nr:peroxiredoxin family protein [Myxococcaceae bacterium]
MNTAVDPQSGAPRPIAVPGRPTLVTFLRGTWCPACRAFLERVKPVFAEARARDIDVAGVVCQGRHWVASWLAVNPLPFPLLADEDRAVAKAWGVFRLLGLDGINIARPATFLIGEDGVVRWAHVGSHLLDRPDNEAILGALKLVDGQRGAFGASSTGTES